MVAGPRGSETCGTLACLDPCGGGVRNTKAQFATANQGCSSRFAEVYTAAQIFCVISVRLCTGSAP